MKIDITTRQATMIYELLHEIKIDKNQVVSVVRDCNSLMKKIEEEILIVEKEKGEDGR